MGSFWLKPWGGRGIFSIPHGSAQLVTVSRLLFVCVPAVMGALESRGVLRRMSDMLEMLMKRMDVLARLENSTDFHKGDEARFPLDRSVGHTDAPWSGAGLGGFAGAKKTPNVCCGVGLSCCVGVVEPSRAGAELLQSCCLPLLERVSSGICEVTVILGVSCSPSPSCQRCGVGRCLRPTAAVELEDSLMAGAVPAAWAALLLNPRASSGWFCCAHIRRVADEIQRTMKQEESSGPQNVRCAEQASWLPAIHRLHPGCQLERPHPTFPW